MYQQIREDWKGCLLEGDLLSYKKTQKKNHFPTFFLVVNNKFIYT